MQRIWILTDIYFPEEISTGYILTKIAECLSNQYEVKVITGPATELFHRQNYPQHEFRNKVEIFRCKGTNFDRHSFIGRLINSVSCSIEIFWCSLKLCQSGDYLLVVTNPPILPFMVLFLHFLKNCKFILLIHDVYPDILVVTNFTKTSSLIVKTWHFTNKIIYSYSSRIITLGRDMTKLIEDQLPNNQSNKVFWIPNWAENEIVFPTEKSSNALLQNLGIVDYFVVLYAGNMGRTHDIENIAAVANMLQNETHIHFLIVGSGAKKIWLEDYINSQKINNLSLISLYDRPRSEQIVSLNACDVAIISFLKGMAGISVPSRMYNHMAAGKPIIALTDDWSELAEVIREEEIGWIVKPGDVEGLLDTIKFAAAHPELCAEMGARAAIAAKTKYTFARTDKKYKELFREVFDTSIKETKN